MYYFFCITRWIALISMPLLAISSFAKSDWAWLALSTTFFIMWLPKVRRF